MCNKILILKIKTRRRAIETINIIIKKILKKQKINFEFIIKL